MSDRRVVMLLLSLLAAGAGVVLLAVSLALLLHDPMLRGGDLGEQVDATSSLVGGAVVGALMAASGVGIGIGLVRRQLPARAERTAVTPPT